MEKIEILEKRVRLAADRIISLREENKKLNSSIKFMENESKRAGEIIRQNETFNEEKKHLANKIEKIIKKLSAFNV